MQFHENLMRLRKQKGLSQEELGNQLNVSRQTVSKWELGQTTPEMEKLIDISKLFEISIDSLVGKSDSSMPEVEKTLSFREQMHYEYKSRKTFKGLPLVHINFGLGLYHAKGVIAIGNIATGLVSFGIISVGLLTFGLLSIALIALGNFSLGVLAFGAVALGLVAFGGLAVGGFAVGGCALGVYAIGGYAGASEIAFGGVAQGGKIAIGQQNANGNYASLLSDLNFDTFSAYLDSVNVPDFIKDIFRFCISSQI